MCRDRAGVRSLIPLSLVEPGSKVEVHEIHGGIGISRRLSCMGIYPGTHLRVLSGGRSGPIVVTCGAKRIGLGFGMGSKIMVAIRKEERYEGC